MHVNNRASAVSYFTFTFQCCGFSEHLLQMFGVSKPGWWRRPLAPVLDDEFKAMWIYQRTRAHIVTSCPPVGIESRSVFLHRCRLAKTNAMRCCLVAMATRAEYSRALNFRAMRFDSVVQLSSRLSLAPSGAEAEMALIVCTCDAYGH